MAVCRSRASGLRKDRATWWWGEVQKCSSGKPWGGRGVGCVGGSDFQKGSCCVLGGWFLIEKRGRGAGLVGVYFDLKTGCSWGVRGVFVEGRLVLMACSRGGVRWDGPGGVRCGAWG